MARLGSLFLALLLVACGDETGSGGRTPIGTGPSEVASSRSPETTGAGELTAQELAAEPDAVVPQPQPASTIGQDPADEIAVESMAEILSNLTNQQSKTGGPVGNQPGVADVATELDWDALIPAEWQPDKIMEQFNADELEDDDPRAEELMEKLKDLWKQAPVVTGLDGKRVKLPGFVVPLGTDAEKVGEFLLVPYYGACIHVPPPPANQTVHVVTPKGAEFSGTLFDTVWVSGTLKVESSSSDLAEAGYRIDATRVEPYE